MKKLCLALSLLAFTLPAVAHDDAPTGSKAEKPMKVEIRNAKITPEGILTGGQPTLDQIKALKAAGYTTIVNLRPDSEVKGAYQRTRNGNLHFDERSEVTKVGMSYKSIPIASARDLSVKNALALDEILKNADGGVVMHCVSGNRVGALLALRAFHVQHKSKQEALEIGRAAGMTGLESAVQDLLSKED
jgi:uncharacterized protein (TIGR01244 family)